MTSRAARVVSSTHSKIGGVRLLAPLDMAPWAGVPTVSSLIVDSVDSATVVVLVILKVVVS